MGMDTEMVAAALQATHKDMIAFLPDDTAIPMGWRFMDKFVQLPILIPPPDKNTIDSYARSLFSTKAQETGDNEAAALSQEILSRLNKKAHQAGDLTKASVEQEISLLKQERNLHEEQVASLLDYFNPEVTKKTFNRLEEGIESFYDNPEIRKALDKATSYFPNNPRELKRFVNTFRFHYFLWWAYRAQGYKGAMLDQLVRWTVLSMCWPDVVRWLRRNRGRDWYPAYDSIPTAPSTFMEISRLRKLEEISGMAKDLKEWQNLIQANFRLDSNKLSWLNSDDLFQFFKNEFNQHQEGERLSDGEGKGLW
jgi:hypothetical protein